MPRRKLRVQITVRKIKSQFFRKYNGSLLVNMIAKYFLHSCEISIYRTKLNKVTEEWTDFHIKKLFWAYPQSKVQNMGAGMVRCNELPPVIVNLFKSQWRWKQSQIKTKIKWANKIWEDGNHIVYLASYFITHREFANLPNNRTNMKNKTSINLNITNLKWSGGTFQWSSIEYLKPQTSDVIFSLHLQLQGNDAKKHVQTIEACFVYVQTCPSSK